MLKKSYPKTRPTLSKLEVARLIIRHGGEDR